MKGKLSDRKRGTFGIRRVGDEWIAKVNGERLGPFATREEAVEAYYRASIARNQYATEGGN
jgi:hypothetical protein